MVPFLTIPRLMEAGAFREGDFSDPSSSNRRIGFMKRILYSLLVASLPFGGVLADAPKSKDAKVTLVYQHELPNVPGKSIKGVLVEYGPGGYSPGHTHPKSAFIYATVLEGEILSQVNDGQVTTYKAGQSFPSCPATATPSAPMLARRSRPSSLRCSWWTRTRRNW